MRVLCVCNGLWGSPGAGPFCAWLVLVILFLGDAVPFCAWFVLVVLFLGPGAAKVVSRCGVVLGLCVFCVFAAVLGGSPGAGPFCAWLVLVILFFRGCRALLCVVCACGPFFGPGSGQSS